MVHLHGVPKKMIDKRIQTRIVSNGYVVAMKDSNKSAMHNYFC